MLKSRYMKTVEVNQPETERAWAIFDWANSAYALVISTAIFPGYFEEYSPEVVSLGRFSFSNTSIYSFAVSFSYVFIACLSPLLSGMADYSGRRMFFLRMFTTIGSISCSLLYFFQAPEQWWLGAGAFMLATIGFAGSLVFYDAYLPLIVTEDRYNQLSAKGFTYGYIGSVILLIGILMMIQQPEWFGLSNGQYGARLGFLLVGVWWLGFAQITFHKLPKDAGIGFSSHMLRKGYGEIYAAYLKVRSIPSIRTFLLSFFFYSAGVQTVIYLATIFAKKELGFETAELIILVLVLQIVAIFGAQIFAALGNARGNRFALLAMISVWFAICLSAYFIYDKTLFYVLASMVGMVMGGIQSVSRASYSMLIPEKTHDTTSYFSFYDVVYKMAIVGGTFFFGLVDNITGNMRYSVLVLAFLFIMGYYFMLKTSIEPRKTMVASE
jgi:UMF1 family MFS transporter